MHPPIHLPRPHQAFLYYRRRRLRIYSAADWPFHDRTMGGNMFFPGANGQGGRNKESKDIGEKPEMWQVMLDQDERAGVASFDQHQQGRFVSAEQREMEQDREERNGSLIRWQPLSITSLTTTQASVPAEGSNNAGGGTSGGRPTSMFSRGLSYTNTPRSNANNDRENVVDNVQSDKSTPPPTSLPIHLSFIIAMPTDPTVVPTAHRDPYDDDEEGQDVPEVALGTTVVELDLTHGSGTQYSSSDNHLSPFTSTSYPPPSSESPNRPLTPNRNTSLGQVLGLTMSEPGPVTTLTSNNGGFSLRDTLGLPAPVQRTRRERRREREAIAIRG
jgi:hypothetical protein